MKRRIIQINEEKCNGCGACAAACHEGAIGMIGGKAKLLRDDYCDGLGDCLPACPTGAITFVEREAAAYDAQAVQLHMQARQACPGQAAQALHSDAGTGSAQTGSSQLAQWPCQIRLVPICAPYFNGSELLIAADCCAYAYANLHADFMRGKITLIGCPKLDAVPYQEKLAQILQANDIRSVTVVRMQVPCCGGLTAAAQKAIELSGKPLALRVATISVDGSVI